MSQVAGITSIHQLVDFAQHFVDNYTNHKISILIADLEENSFTATLFNQSLLCLARYKGVFNPIHFGNKYIIQAQNFALGQQLYDHI